MTQREQTCKSSTGESYLSSKKSQVQWDRHHAELALDLKGSAGLQVGWARICCYQPPIEGLLASIPGDDGSCKGPCSVPGAGVQPFSGPFLHGAFAPPQDSIYDEMEDKWSKKKADWEKEEKLEQEKILLQQSKYRNFYLLDGTCTQKTCH